VTWRDRIAMGILLVPTIGLLGQGIVYLTTSEFMPYHSAALGVPWVELPANYQGFVIGVIKGMGAGSIAVSIALLILLWVPVRRGDVWARWAAPVIGMVFTALTAYAAFTIDRLTPAATPWRETLLLTPAYLGGGVLSLWPTRRMTKDVRAAPGQGNAN